MSAGFGEPCLAFVLSLLAARMGRRLTQVASGRADPHVGSIPRRPLLMRENPDAVQVNWET